MKVKQESLSEKEVIKTLDILYTAAGAVKGRMAMKRFLRDLLTPSERLMLGRRILIARLLVSGASYEEIVKRMGASERTVAKVHRWLRDQMPGYEEALKGLENEMKKRSKRHEVNQNLAAMKRKYPLHFMLFPWPKGYKPKGW